MNNPLKYTDPTGHNEEDWFDDQWKSEFRAAHNEADPKANDYAYRFLTMAWENGMIVRSLGIDQAFLIPDDPGADMGANMTDSARSAERYYAGDDPAGSFLADLGDFTASVLPDSKWDIKRHYGSQYQDYGNFHYGAVGAARGYGRGFLLRGAGVAQFADDTLNKTIKAVFTALDVALRTDLWSDKPLRSGRGEWRSPKPGLPGIVGPYSDDPRDQAMVDLGITFYGIYRKVGPK